MANKIDVLNRQEFVDNLIKIVRQLADNHQGCTFAIDGRWGSGKSYILDMFEEQISLFQDPNAAGDRYIVFRYDCWQYDYYDEPAIAIIAAIRNICENYNRLLPKASPTLKATFKAAKDLGKELVCNVIETKTGWSPQSIIEQYEAQKNGVEEESEKSHKYDTFFEFKTILTKTRGQLSKMAKDKPIIVVVDELDRCVPEYAIKVLERLHHLFENQPNIIVILAYDGTKLSHVIKNIYGIEEQDVQHFMRKFIDFSVQLDNGLVSNSFWERHSQYLKLFNIDLLNKNELQQLNEFASKIFSGTDARTQEKIIERIIILHKLSFGELSHPSILYYELLHQIIFEKCPLQYIDSWIFDINIVESKLNPEAANAFGTSLYQYLKDTERSIHKAYISFGNGRKYFEITEDPLSLAFWYIATLVHPIGDDDIDDDVCRWYYLKNATNYSKLTSAAKKFDNLTNIIK